MKNRFGLLFASLGLVMLVGAGCASEQAPEAPAEDGAEAPVESVAMWPAEGETIKLGWVGPLTGDVSALGQDALKMTELGIKEVNEAGGINGYQVELVAEDGKCNPKDAVSATNKLLQVDGVSAIFGGLCSGETTAMAPIAEPKEVVMLSACSSAPNVTEAGDFVFRTYPSDAFEGAFAAQKLYDEGIRKVAVVATLGDWGTGIKNVFSSSFEALGGEIVFSADFAQEERDFKTVLTKVKASDAELIYVPAYTDATLAMLKQVQELEITLPLFGGNSWSDIVITSDPLAEGIRYPLAKKPEVTAEWTAKVEAAGAVDTACTRYSYDNTQLMLSAIGEVGVKGTDIRDALYAVEGYEGFSGVITLDENGDRKDADFVIYQVVDGEPVMQ